MGAKPGEDLQAMFGSMDFILGQRRAVKAL